MIEIIPHVFLSETEIEFVFIRAAGPGGQNVNKVATAVQLRFNVLASPNLSDYIRHRLVYLAGNKINSAGELIIKANRHRTQERNKQDAMQRLQELIQRAATPIKKRKKTKPSAASRERRLSSKKIHAKIKSLRRKSNFD